MYGPGRVLLPCSNLQNFAIFFVGICTAHHFFWYTSADRMYVQTGCTSESTEYFQCQQRRGVILYATAVDNIFGSINEAGRLKLCPGIDATTAVHHPRDITTPTLESKLARACLNFI